jgi:hypothetical protein
MRSSTSRLIQRLLGVYTEMFLDNPLAAQHSLHPTWGTRRVFEHFLGFGGIPFR